MMANSQVAIETSNFRGSPQVEGFTLRGFQGDGDYSHIAAIIAGCKDADQIERVDSEEDIRRYYSHLVNCNPYQDMRFVEAGGQTIGYSRVMWWAEPQGTQIYRSLAFLLPAWRRRGIGSALLDWGETRLEEIAADNPPADERFFESAAADTETGTQALLEKSGYTPVRHAFTMVRPDLETIPEALLPQGLEVRPVKLQDLPAIRAAMVEAFHDHWGFSEENELTVEQWVENPNFDPSLWRVAWDGDQVAGMVLSYIDARENETYHRKRGWTEDISVRRPWRRRGLARALLVQSLHAVRERGMLEAALGVDTQNPNGALRLYESVGFQVVKRWTSYRKPVL
jgi:ribosomal protein S18 acetylase RimI-like enzyme